MLSVIIPTLNCERALALTLAMLVPGAVSGMVREVVLADGGSTDATLEVADAAGCSVLTSVGAAWGTAERSRGGGAVAMADVFACRHAARRHLAR